MIISFVFACKSSACFSPPAPSPLSAFFVRQELARQAAAGESFSFSLPNSKNKTEKINAKMYKMQTKAKKRNQTVKCAMQTCDYIYLYKILLSVGLKNA